jgi:hypothetical protein
MFAIEFIQSHELRGVDPSDAHWTRMIIEHDTEQAAKDEKGWLEMEGAEYTYRIVDTVAGVVAA